MQNDQNIFDGDHHGQRPDDDRQDSNEVLVGWWCWKGRGVHVERTGPNVTVDDTDGLICKPQQISTMEDLGYVRIVSNADFGFSAFTCLVL